MHRWSLWSKEDQTPRCQLLSKVLNDIGEANVFLPLEMPPDEMLPKIHNVVKTYDSLRVGPPYGESVLRSFIRQPVSMNSIQACDLLVNRLNVWWPENVLMRAISRLLATDLSDINLMDGVLIVGSGAAARAILVACVQTGFTRIGVTDQYDERGILMVQEMRKSLFNLKLDFIPENTLTSLSGTYSLAVNTTPPVSTNTIVEQLTYFNFMRTGGAIIDFVLTHGDTLIMREGRDLGVRVIGGSRVASFIGQQWAEFIFKTEKRNPKFVFPLEEYYSQLKAIYQSAGEAETASASSGNSDQTVVQAAEQTAAQAQEQIPPEKK